MEPKQQEHRGDAPVQNDPQGEQPAARRTPKADAGGADAPQSPPQGGAREAGEEKWFSQEEVNEIVKKRLARERDGQQGPAFGQAGRLAKELALREQEVLKRERKIQAKEELAAGGLPAEAAELLHYDSEEAFRESFEAMQKLLLDKLQVSVQEMFREGGRVPPRSTESAPAKPDPLKAAFLPCE